jgi:hypothetical protein
MIQLEQVQFLIDLSPGMEYLQVRCASYIDFQLLLRFILMKNINKDILHLRSLCLCVSSADEKMIQELQTMIETEKLLHDYSTKRILDKIYFQW